MAISSPVKQIVINESERTAELTWQGTAPSSGVDQSQGSHQVMAKGNHFCGTGFRGEILERTADGRLEWAAGVANQSAQTYQAVRHAWTGTPPLSKLWLFSYAAECAAPNMAFWVSWNGATELASWCILASSSSTVGGFSEVASAPQEGAFETRLTASGFALYACTVLGRSPLVRTFVPADRAMPACSDSDSACGFSYPYDSAPQARCFIEDRFDGW